MSAVSNPEQLSLSVALNDEATFDNFYAPLYSTLAQTVAAIESNFISANSAPAVETFLYLWGAAGSGVTHLMQATCHKALSVGKSVQYLPLNEMRAYPPEELLADMEQLDVICLDNVDAVVGDSAWEEALFNLFNQMRGYGRCLLIGGQKRPKNLGVVLPDLESRLNWGLTFLLPSLDDDEKIELLKFRAERRGLDMSDSTCRYILNHAPRDMKELMLLLDLLDKGSLREQRKLTIPFIKKIFNW
jgi:DnaA family protein